MDFALHFYLGVPFPFAIPKKIGSGSQGRAFRDQAPTPARRTWLGLSPEKRRHRYYPSLNENFILIKP